MSNPKNTPAKFWATADRSGGPDACWPFQNRSVVPGGYHIFRWGGLQKRAHVLAYELTVGPVPPGLMILHACDNPACVNPAHLRAGTHRENMRDRCARARTALGDRHGMTKLPTEAVRELLGFYAVGGWSQNDLAWAYGVSQATVWGYTKGVRRGV